jgi:prevent-host-death family protein
MNWNLSEAKSRLSEVLTQADAEAQTIVRRDRDYVLMSGDEYRKLMGQEATFTEFLIDTGPRFDELKPMKRMHLTMRDLQF